MHGTCEVYCVQNLYFIWLVDDFPFVISLDISIIIDIRNALFKHPPALNQNRAFRVCNYIGTMHLHQVWLHEKAGLSAATSTYDQDIFISGILG